MRCGTGQAGDAHGAQVKGAGKQPVAAHESQRKVAGYVHLLTESGSSLAKIAISLNAEGHTTHTGKAFTAMQISRRLKRAAST